MQPDVVRLREMRRRAAAADAVESLDEAVAVGQLYGVAEGLSDDGRGEPKRAQLVVIPPLILDHRLLAAREAGVEGRLCPDGLEALGDAEVDACVARMMRHGADRRFDQPRTDRQRRDQAVALLHVRSADVAEKHFEGQLEVVIGPGGERAATGEQAEATPLGRQAIANGRGEQVGQVAVRLRIRPLQPDDGSRRERIVEVKRRGGRPSARPISCGEAPPVGVVLKHAAQGGGGAKDESPQRVGVFVLWREEDAQRRAVQEIVGRDGILLQSRRHPVRAIVHRQRQVEARRPRLVRSRERRSDE